MSPSVVAVSSGDSPTSKTRALAAAALEIEGGGRLIDLIDLPADALLGRRADPAVDDAVAVARTAVVLCASAGGPAHFLALDTGGRSLVASLGGWTVPTVVYATGADFDDGVPGPAVMGMLTEALGQAHAVGAGVDREPGPR
jgi:NAD(P)H-dependent FMN reductase